MASVEARFRYPIGPVAAGRVLRVEVDVGERVQAGQLLGEMDPVDLDQRVAAQEAAQRRADAATRRWTPPAVLRISRRPCAERPRPSAAQERPKTGPTAGAVGPGGFLLVAPLLRCYGSVGAPAPRVIDRSPRRSPSWPVVAIASPSPTGRTF